MNFRSKNNLSLHFIFFLEPSLNKAHVHLIIFLFSALVNQRLRGWGRSALTASPAWPGGQNRAIFKTSEDKLTLVYVTHEISGDKPVSPMSYSKKSSNHRRKKITWQWTQCFPTQDASLLLKCHAQGCIHITPWRFSRLVLNKFEFLMYFKIQKKKYSDLTEIKNIHVHHNFELLTRNSLMAFVT